MTRPGGITDPAAEASIDLARRMLRLPTIRARFAEMTKAAAREQMTYRAFLSSCCTPSATTATIVATPAGSAAPAFPATSGWPTSTTPPTRPEPRRDQHPPRRR